MLVINDYVNKKGTTHPTGIIKALENGVALVRWGVEYDHIFTEKIPVENLQLITHTITSRDEVEIRQAKEKSASVHIHEE